MRGWGALAAVALATVLALAGAAHQAGPRQAIKQGAYVNFDYGPCLPCTVTAFLVAEEGVVDMLVLDAANYDAFSRKQPYKAVVEASVGTEGDPPYRFLPPTAVRLQEHERLHVVLSARRSPAVLSFAAAFFVHHVFTSERSHNMTIVPGQGNSIAVSPFPCPCTVVYEVATADPARQLVSVLVLDEANYAALKEGRSYATYTGASQPNGVGTASVGPVLIESTNGTRINLILANAQGAPVSVSYTASVTGSGRPAVYVAGEAGTAGGRINLLGKFLGPANSEPRVLLGGRPCAEAKVALEGFLVTCTAPPGAGHRLPISVRTPAGQESAATGEYTFSYAAPVVESATAAPAAGGRITVRGQNFGEAGAPVAVWLAGRPCADAAVLEPHVAIACTAPAGAGRGVDVLVRVAGRLSEESSLGKLAYADRPALWRPAGPPDPPAPAGPRPGPAATASPAGCGAGAPAPATAAVARAAAQAQEELECAGSACLPRAKHAWLAALALLAPAGPAPAPPAPPAHRGGVRGAGAAGRGAGRGPYVSFVVAAPEGAAGAARLQLFVDTTAELCRRARLAAELLLVEPHPPPAAGPRAADRVRWGATNASVLPARLLSVPEAALPPAGGAARWAALVNAGVQRARGEFVFVTNEGVLLAEQLVRVLAAGALRPDALYLARSYALRSPLPAGMPHEEVMQACADNGLAAAAPHLGLPAARFGAEEGAPLDLRGREVADPADVLVDQPQDALLLHRSAWCVLRGVPEGPGRGTAQERGGQLAAMALARAYRSVLFRAPAALCRLPASPPEPPPRALLPDPDALLAARTRPFAAANGPAWGLAHDPAVRELPL